MTDHRTAVIICAYTEDRWQDLVEAVASVRGQTLPPDDIVLVIDHHPGLLARAREQFNGLTIIENPDAPGLSNARNAGIAATDADLLAFMDDDAVAEPDWLKMLVDVMADPHVMVAGGYVRPNWLDGTPRWLPEEFYWVVGCTHRGVPERVAEIRNPVGANMLIRRQVFDMVGTFNTAMGRVGTLPVGCEETELCIRVRQQLPGSRILFVPDAVVHHKVPAKRTTWRYFMSRCYAEGISKAAVTQLAGRKDGLSAERTHAFKTLPQAVLRNLAGIVRGDVAGLARAGAIVAGLFTTTAGYLRGQRSSTPEKTADAKTDGPMNIMMVSARFFPFAGGTETHTYEVARRMVEDGHRVTVLTTTPGGTLPADEVRDGITIRRVRAYPAQKDYYFAPALYSEIQARRPDVIHIQGYHTFVAPMAMFAAWRAGIPYVVTFHSGGHSSFFRNLLRGIQRVFLSPLLSRAAQLIGVSDFEADFFARHTGIDRSRFVVVPNGAHLPELDHVVQPEPHPLIVSSGRLERYKGHQHVITAFSRVLQNRPDARLRIAGTGPYEPELNRLVDSLGVNDFVEIKAVPPANRTGMAELLSRSSLVVLFSEYEAHPVAVMEALSLKRPVLVANTSGLSELAERGLVQAVPLTSGPDELAEAMIHQLDDPLIPAGITLPTWDDCAGKLLDIYRQVA